MNERKPHGHIPFNLGVIKENCRILQNQNFFFVKIMIYHNNTLKTCKNIAYIYHRQLSKCKYSIGYIWIDILNTESYIIYKPQTTIIEVTSIVIFGG